MENFCQWIILKTVCRRRCEISSTARRFQVIQKPPFLPDPHTTILLNALECEGGSGELSKKGVADAIQQQYEHCVRYLLLVR